MPRQTAATSTAKLHGKYAADAVPLKNGVCRQPDARRATAEHGAVHPTYHRGEPRPRATAPSNMMPSCSVGQQYRAPLNGQYSASSYTPPFDCEGRPPRRLYL